jgi:hypothetical protein
MKKKIALFLVCILLVASFLTEFHTIKVEATGNFLSINDNFGGSYLNSQASTDYWISYNDGYADDAFGLTNGGIITMAIGLTDIELAPYRNYVIDQINVAFGSENNPTGEIVDYKVWIKDSLPSDPYCGCTKIIASGTSTGDVWNLIDVDDTLIPYTGYVYIGINIEYVSGQYPCGMDEHQSGPTRAALLTYPGYGWTDLFSYGYPSVWCLDVGVSPNSPPNTPTYLNPSKHEINVDVNDSLLWSCSDPDGDELTYDVYFGTSSNPPLASKNRILNYYNPPGEMNYNTKYYWKIVAKDEHGSSTTGPIWDFTTSSEPNNPPYTPSNPYPENGSINIATDLILNWSGGDPDVGDTVTYDVYFSGMLPIRKIASNISNTSINPGNLVNGLTYFWNVVAWDNHNASTIGPSWHFTTINPNNRPPNKPSKPSGQIKGKIGQNYTYIASATDPEGDQLYYNWSWGDGTYSGWIGPYYNGEFVNESHSWMDKGNYDIKVKAKDILGMESDWSDPLAIRMPKMYTYNQIIQLLMKALERIPFFEKILNLYYN